MSESVLEQLLVENALLRVVAEKARRLLKGFDEKKANGPILDRRSDLRIALEALEK